MAGSDPRVVLAERLTQLWALAGKPTYDKLARDAQPWLVPDPDTGRRPTVSKQRISDWKSGSQVPREFTGVAAVIAVLTIEARKRTPIPPTEGLYSSSEWNLWWRQAIAASAQAQRGDGSGTVRTETADPADGEDEPDRSCPYRGLAAFGAEHVDYFFGRDDATDNLIGRIDELCATGELLMLVAPSGAGKSSLLGAGLLPAIRSGRLAVGGAARWPIIAMTPGPTPNATLAQRIPGLRHLIRDADHRPVTDTEHDDWTRSVRAAISEMTKEHAGVGARLILVVDQFEEVFALCDDETERGVFISALHAATRGPDSPALAILGMRADFYGDCLEHPPLLEALQHRTFVLTPMTTKQLRQAITGPARAAGLRIQPHLDEQLIQDAGISPNLRSRGDSGVPSGTLPLLSHALRATWQHRRQGQLTIAGYKATGGIHGAVTQTAERALAELTPIGQSAAMNLLLRLIRVGEDHTQDTRRRCDTHQLLEQAHDRQATAQALEALVQARLVIVDTDTAQITHEALLRVWPRLRRQIDEHRTALLGLQHLEDDAQAWAGRDRDHSRLYRGDQLADAQQWTHDTDTGGAGPSALAREFLDHAVAARDRAAVETARRVARDRHVRTAIAALAAFGLVLASVAIVAGVKASNREDDANFANVLAQADRLQASDPSLAAQLDLVAHRMRPNDNEVAGRILSTQNTPLAATLPGSGNAAIDYTGFSPDGRALATASNSIQLWDLTAHEHPRPAGPPLAAGDSYVSTAAFTPDGHLLASTGGDGTLRIWDVTQLDHPVRRAEIPEGHGSSSLLAVDPNGHLLATGGSDGTVTLWDITDPAQPRPPGPPLAGHTGIVRAIAFSPDGHTLAAGGDDHTILLYDITDPAHPQRVGPALHGHSEGLRSVAFSPDGHLLASGGDDKSVRLWNVANPTQAAALGEPFGDQKGSVWSVSFSPDGRTLASGSQDGTTKLWTITDPASPNQLGSDLFSRTGGIFAIGFSPDGHHLATGGDDGTTLLWTLPTTVLAGPTSRVFSIAFSPDGYTLAVGDHDHSIWLWNVTDPHHPAVLAPPLIAHDGIVTKIVFSPDGHTLASSSGDDHTTRLWDLTDPAHPAPIGAPMPQHTQYEAALAFTPDGRTLATSATDTSIQLWDVADRTHPNPIGKPIAEHSDFVQNVAISPDPEQTVLAVASYDGTISLWNITNPTHPQPFGAPLQPDSGKVRNLAFSPDGHTLATTGEDKSIHLWDVTEPGKPAPTRTLLGHHGAVLDVAFTPDRKALSSGGADKTARVWSFGNSEPSSLPLTGHTGRVTGVKFSPNGTILATGSDDDTVRLWDLSLGDSATRICSTTRGALSADQWNQLLPQLPYAPACS